MTLTPVELSSTATSKYLRSGVGAGRRSWPRRSATTPNGPKTPAAQKRKSLFVIVVGETARADHFALQRLRARQQRLNSPRSTGLINFPQAFSCGTDTAQSVPCMFSGLGRSAAFPIDSRAVARKLARYPEARRPRRDLARKSIRVQRRLSARARPTILTGLKHPAFYARTAKITTKFCSTASKTESLNLQRDTVIVMHMMGSHGPAYWKRYPDRFEAFKPTCKESQFQPLHARRDRQRLRQHNPVYGLRCWPSWPVCSSGAGQHNVDARACWYMSDHGESLGENNIYLHGMPYAFAPQAQIHVPMVMWMSPGFRDSLGIDHGCMKHAPRKKPATTRCSIRCSASWTSEPRSMTRRSTCLRRAARSHSSPQ